MTFRNWIPEGIYSRYGAERFDEELNRMTKGRHLSYAELFRKKGVGKSLIAVGNGLFKKLTFNLIKNNSFDELEEIDRVNMEKNMSELMLFSTMLLFMAMLKGMDDDDDKNKTMIKLLVAQSMRLESDIVFYTSPGATMSTLRNIVPVMTSAYNIWRIIPNTVNYIFDGHLGAEDTISAGPFAGQSKLGRSVSKVIPGLNEILRTLELDDLSTQSISGRSNIL